MTMLPNRRLSCNARGDSHFKRTGTCACLTFKGLEQFGAFKWVQPKEEVPFRTLSWNKMWQKIMCWFRLSTSWGEKNFKLHLQNRIIPLRRTFQNFWWVPLLFIWEFSPRGLMSRIHIDPHKYALHSNFRSTFIALATLVFTHWWHFSWFSKDFRRSSKTCWKVTWTLPKTFKEDPKMFQSYNNTNLISVKSLISSLVGIWKTRHLIHVCSFIWILKVAYFSVKHSCLFNECTFVHFVAILYKSTSNNQFFGKTWITMATLKGWYLCESKKN